MDNKKKKKNIYKLIGRTFLKTIIIIFLILGVGVVSYQLTMLYHTATAKTQVVDVKSYVMEPDGGDISTNLIYSVDEDSKEIKAIVLEILNTDTNNLDYVTIPVNTKLTVSTEMFQKMQEVSTSVPQNIKLSKLCSYFEGNVAYEYGILAIKDTVGINIGYYTAMPMDEFDDYFEMIEDKAYTLSAQGAAEVSGIDNASDMEEFIAKEYGKVTCNLQYMKKIKYASTFLKVNKDMIYNHLIAGKESGDNYILDYAAAKKQVRKIRNAKAYTEKQEKVSVVKAKKGSSSSVSSKGKTIEVLNGSGINGLAASIKEKLETEGYTVSNIGDYSSTSESITRIVVKDEAYGDDLLTYFNNAEKEVDTTGTMQTDIQIILGSNDGY